MLAVMQCKSVPGNKPANLRQLELMSKEAASAGARIMITPELMLTGYNLGKRLVDLAEPRDGSTIMAAQKIAADNQIALIIGFPERVDDTVYNSAAVIDEAGDIVTVFRKLHLYGDKERVLFRAGMHPQVVDLAGIKLGLAICYDIEFPEVARMLVRMGAQVIAVPTCNMTPYWSIPTTIIRARALENNVCVAYANHHGTESELNYTGLSCIVGANGEDLARAHEKGDQLLLADVEAVLAKSTNYDQISDLRKDLF